jgi:hypothetical protein
MLERQCTAKASSPKARPRAFSLVIWSGIDTAGLLYNMGFSASEIKRENPVKSENLPGCAVQMGSVAGIIVFNVINRTEVVKLFFKMVIGLMGGIGVMVWFVAGGTLHSRKFSFVENC